MKIPERKRSRGEMLPLMDVIFMLMVMFIFMLVQMRPDFGISVELPDVGASATTQKPEDEKKRVWVSVDANQTVFVNKQSVADCLSAAQTILATAGCAPADLRVVLKGDKGATYGSMVEVYDALRAVGLSDVLWDVNKGK